MPFVALAVGFAGWLYRAEVRLAAERQGVEGHGAGEREAGHGASDREEQVWIRKWLDTPRVEELSRSGASQEEYEVAYREWRRVAETRRRRGAGRLGAGR